MARVGAWWLVSLCGAGVWHVYARVRHGRLRLGTAVAAWGMGTCAGAEVPDVRWAARFETLGVPRNHVGYLHATYRDHPRPEPGRELVLLDTSRRGYVEAVSDNGLHLAGRHTTELRNDVILDLRGILNNRDR